MVDLFEHVLLFSICIMMVHLKPSKGTELDIDSALGTHPVGPIVQPFYSAFCALPIFLALEAIYWGGDVIINSNEVPETLQLGIAYAVLIGGLIGFGVIPLWYRDVYVQKMKEYVRDKSKFLQILNWIGFAILAAITFGFALLILDILAAMIFGWAPNFFLLIT